MSIFQKDQNLLWHRSAGRCSMSSCRKVLSKPASKHLPSGRVIIGEVCHIVAKSPTGPRGRSKLPLAERDHYPNLIRMCLEHHTTIDHDPKAWSAKHLLKIKAEHELWVDWPIG